jgi:hypothetical protein
MKINGRLIRTAAMSFILGVTGMLILTSLFFPQLASYNPENPDLFAEQKLVAGLTTVFGIFCAVLFSKR